jgi:hypothetical protein
VSDLRSVRAAAVAVAAALVLGSCGGADPSAPTSGPPSAASGPVGDAPAPQAPPVAEPAAVESAVIRASSCAIDERFGRDLDGIRFLKVGVGPSGVDAPHEALEGSFTCNVAPAGTQSFGAGLFGDPTQATEMVSWFRGGEPCRPVAAVGPWMLFAARAADQPQQSAELEAAVAELGGQMTATCR